jgi:hypothetical protein
VDIQSIYDQRAARRAEQASKEIERQKLNGAESLGHKAIIGPNPVYGGYDVSTASGGRIRGVLPDTSRSFGKGDQVSVVVGSRGARLDAKSSGLGAAGSLASSATSATGSTSGTSGSASGSVVSGGGGGGSGGNDGSTPRYRPNPDGSCSPVYYTGGTKPGDYDDPGKCAGDQPNSKSYYCEGGKCYATTAGNGKYNSLADCQAGIVPGFKGGQCEGTVYSCKFKWSGKAQQTGSSEIKNAVGNGEFIATGPISGSLTFGSTGYTPSYPGASSMSSSIDYEASGLNPAGGVFVSDASGSITETSPISGPDDCGDKPDSCPT